MKKSDMIKKLTSETGLKQTQVDAVLNGLAGVWVEELILTGEITLPGIGAFKVKQHAARAGRNPQTGETIEIPAKSVVVFKANKQLRDTLNK